MEYYLGVGFVTLVPISLRHSECTSHKPSVYCYGLTALLRQFLELLSGLFNCLLLVMKQKGI